ncbi:MAG: hypothetical protein H7Y36_12475 [Armatimonadetes bacterium]|nr:hypothetical protein [Akkermansiaceae bacterium]
MSTTRGIFETFPNQAATSASPQPPAASPFAIASDNGSHPAPSPFAAAPPAPVKKEALFAVVQEDAIPDDAKALRLPDRRKAPESPFQISEPQGFGFEAPPQALKANPFEAPRPVPPIQHQPPAPSPFSIEKPPAPAAHNPAPNAFGGWPQAEAGPFHAPAMEAPPSLVAAEPSAFSHAPAPAPQIAPPPIAANPSNSDSYSIKQLELRAIFGVDREMTHEEIVQRARSLPGIRQIARVSEQDIAAVDALKLVISNLGFGSSPIKLYSGSVPIEFIREGRTLLAVQTDGGFAPGVRETLMIVARELTR